MESSDLSGMVNLQAKGIAWFARTHTHTIPVFVKILVCVNVALGMGIASIHVCRRKIIR